MTSTSDSVIVPSPLASRSSVEFPSSLDGAQGSACCPNQVSGSEYDLGGPDSPNLFPIVSKSPISTLPSTFASPGHTHPTTQGQSSDSGGGITSISTLTR